MKITNFETGEVCAIERDVCAVHPAWVHQQCGTASESELQAFLGALNVSMWYDRAGQHLGPDAAGIEMFR